jgi:epoxide hydrolase-like predicted phosphatase
MHTNIIQAVIFDVGGVLLRTEDRSVRRRLEQRLGLGEGEAEFLVFNSEHGRKAQLGLTSAAEHWSWLAQRLGLNEIELAQFQHEFWGGDRLDEHLIQMIRSLRSVYQIAIISNAMDDLHDLLTRKYPIADAFDLIVGSAYEHVMKPDAVIFERTLQRLGCQPQEAVFIDDFAHNVEGARRLGLQAIHYQPGLDLAEELERLGVRSRI